ncbi:pyrroline-5-carboxylate reductase [Aspergillus heteromorphus CBS 117.55]|uniref:Pyrroline-5-carboxylate reductase n=1 Tax=Aspergillus heteromorphus CBS 117.55 TaxID=1448321 RepID=A0A317WEX3_9EURO|nr:pyrroline-5-carboxylate reductase [Aspergillus heteromorphus CBS 117.55]PWY85026.1 pyrroline-5-carboxylate reductase [Aspergillus heteromorphus CBS 117.55]
MSPPPSPSGQKPKTLAFIGCGNMGSAILNGLLSATAPSTSSIPANPPKITTFIINTKTANSAARLRSQYAPSTTQAQVTITHGQNVQAMQQADVILLACKPFLARGILSEPGIQEAVRGKIVVSIMAGVKTQDILGWVYGEGYSEDLEEEPVIVRAMPNVAARLGESMTIVEVPEGEAEEGEVMGLMGWLFGAIGKVKVVAADLFDVGTMLVGASMAVLTVPLEGVLDGCVAEGLRRAEALEMAAQTMVGMAALLRDGVHPAILRESISSPRGCTIQGVLAVERAGVRGRFADALIEGTRHLKKDN